jgi:hypothetical protein
VGVNNLARSVDRCVTQQGEDSAECSTPGALAFTPRREADQATMHAPLANVVWDGRHHDRELVVNSTTTRCRSTFTSVASLLP